MNPLGLRSVNVTRYVEPLREGGSLPAIVEADDDFSYVIKFWGAGQGKKALIAELIGGELARAMGLRVPELVFMTLDDSFGRMEADEEIQDLLKFSVGLNLGLHYLPGSITYDPVVSVAEPLESSKVVVLDSLITNIDRTARNTNLLNWNKELWLIDHGASIYFHHSWDNWQEHATRSFPAIKDHVLLPRATELHKAAATIQETISDSMLKDIVDTIPDIWLSDDAHEVTAEERRRVYLEFLRIRLSQLDSLVTQADDARKASI
ncbi:MAG: aminotransferase class I and II [Bacteroidia bacterium]|nr:aminotransferase class I and II [Bacteroidia bacterium]